MQMGIDKANVYIHRNKQTNILIQNGGGEGEDNISKVTIIIIIMVRIIIMIIITTMMIMMMFSFLPVSAICMYQMIITPLNAFFNILKYSAIHVYFIVLQHEGRPYPGSYLSHELSYFSQHLYNKIMIFIYIFNSIIFPLFNASRVFTGFVYK